MMSLPIVKVTTEDKYILHGLLSESEEKPETIIIHFHGSAGNFYQSSFYPYLFQMAGELNIPFLSTNNRGHGVYNIEAGAKSTGAAVEIFDDCIYDIDAWIKFAKNKGYKNIILEGHSFGSSKVQYYFHNGKYGSGIKALVLLGFTDPYGGQLDYLKRKNIKNEDVLNEAKSLVDKGKPLQLLSYPLINWGELPQAAASYLNFMSPNSALSRVLPIKNPSDLTNFREINVPILGVVGDHNEYTVVPPEKAVDLLNKENKNAVAFMIKGSNHMYEGKEKELVGLMKKFFKNLKFD